MYSKVERLKVRMRGIESILFESRKRIIKRNVKVMDRIDFIKYRKYLIFYNI